jgi:hypothetical protein
MSREVRLLLVTIVVSAALLLLLARYRFPSAERPAQPVAVAPLERLAARATFDELASIVADLEPAIGRAVVVLRVLPPPPRHASSAEGLDLPRFVPALRIRDDVALAALQPGASILGVVGGDVSIVPPVIAEDRVRGLVTVRVPKRPAPTLSILSANQFGATARYVAAVEGTTGRPPCWRWAARPVPSRGRSSSRSTAAWSASSCATKGCRHSSRRRRCSTRPSRSCAASPRPRGTWA